MPSDESPPPLLFSLQTPQLVRLTQGLSTLFWSLPLILSLSLLAVFAPTAAQLPSHRLWLATAFALCCWGGYQLSRVELPSRRWRPRLERMMMTGVLGGYFSVFVPWWRQAPQSGYLLLNVLAFCVAGVALLVCASLALERLAQLFQEEALVSDFRLALVLAIFLGVVPPLGVLALGYVWAESQGPELSLWLRLGREITDLIVASWRWTILGVATACLFPVSVICVGIWKLKSRALQMLKNR